MKKLSLLIYLCLSILFWGISCKKDSLQVINNALTSQTTTFADKPLIDFLISQKFDTTGIKDLGESFLIEGDIILNKNNIKTIMNQRLNKSQNVKPNRNQTFQYAVNPINSPDGTGIVNWNNTLNITYFIDPSITIIPNGNDWINAINTATQNWTNIPNCSVTFTQVFIAGNAQLTFYADNAPTIPAAGLNLPASAFAGSMFSQNNLVGSFISINHNAPNSSADGKIHIMTHEIGHALGMRHANWSQIGEPLNASGFGGQQIQGANLLGMSPTNDINSIMFNSYDGVTPIGFDNWDLFAAQMLYPDNIAPTNFTLFVYTPNQGGNRGGTGPSAIVYYTNLNNNTWNTVRIDRLDNLGNLIYSWTYTNGAQNYLTATAPGVPAGNFGLIIAYDRGTIPTLPHGTLYFRVTVLNYKGDFGFTLPTKSITW